MISAVGYLKSLKTIINQFIYALLIIFSTNSFAKQNTIDSLEHVLASENINDSVKVSILLQLFQEYLPTNFNKAKSIADQAIDLLENSNDTIRKRQAYLFLTRLYSSHKKFGEAIGVTQKLVNVDEKSGNLNQIAEDLIQLGTIYQDKRDFSKSLHYFEEAEAIFKTTGFYKGLKKAYVKMIEVYTVKNDFENAYKHYQLLATVSDSINQDETQRLLANIKSKYENEKKEAAIIDLSKDNTLKENEIKRYAVIRNVFIIAFVFILIIALLLYRMIKLKRQSNRLLREKNDRIDIQKREVEIEKKLLENYNHSLQKENILAQYETLKNQVNPHFLFNSLNALSSLITSNPDKAIEFTNEFSKVYRYVLELKENLVIKVMEELTLVNSYLFLQQIRFEKNLTISIDIKAEYLDCFIPPFSLQLLVDNVIKHNVISMASPLKISIYSEGDFLVVKNSIGQQPENVISTGTGIKNLLDRYDIVSDIAPEFEVTETEYIAKIPVIKED